MSTNLGDLLRGAGFTASPVPTTPPPPEAPSEAVPTDGRVLVRVQRKGFGGKTATTLEGLPSPLEPFAKRLRAALGVGARAEGELVVVQGDQADRVLKWLADQGFSRARRG